MEIISVSCSCVRSNIFLMLHLCCKCPTCTCLLRSTLFLPSLLLAFHLRHISSVLPLKIKGFLCLSYAICLLPFLNLSADRATNAGVSYQCDGVIGQSAENMGCCVIKLLSSGKPLVLRAAISAALLMCMLQLGWNSNSAGSQAFWGELPVQPGSEYVPLCQPSEDCPGRALAF